MKETMLNVIRLAGQACQGNRWLANLMGLAVLLTFLGGLVLMGIHRHWMIYLLPDYISGCTHHF